MILKADVFPKLQTMNDMVRQIYKKYRFRRPFKKRNGKQSQTLSKSQG